MQGYRVSGEERTKLHECNVHAKTIKNNSYVVIRFSYISKKLQKFVLISRYCNKWF